MIASQDRGESERNGAQRFDPEAPLDRADVGIRLLLSILFAIVLGVLETVIVALVVFQLGFSLVTRREPSTPVRSFGNHLSAYYYRVLRYLTHNAAAPPFPFADLESPLEATGDGTDPTAKARPQAEAASPSGGVTV